VIGTRVHHATTGAPGVITQTHPGSTFNPGPWAHVIYDDGLRCWNLQESLVPEGSVQ
jgi:hypothetical protein